MPKKIIKKCLNDSLYITNNICHRRGCVLVLILKNCKYGTPFILSEPVLSIDNGRLVHVLWGDDMLAARYVSCLILI